MTETKQKIQAYLDEIDRKQQKIPGKTKYIRHVSDKERKILYFTGKIPNTKASSKTATRCYNPLTLVPQ